MSLHRIPRKQLDTSIFYVEDDLERIEGLDRTTAQVHDHLHDVGDNQAYHKAGNVGFDPVPSPLIGTNVQVALSEFANKPIADPTSEQSGVPVTTSHYQVTASERAYVGTNPGDNPNSLFAVYNTDGHELPITVTGVTDDAAGLNSVVGQVWFANPYVQLSAAPNEPIIIKYGTENSLAALPIDALLKEGVIVGEIDSEVINAIADIKGTAWDTAVPSDRNLVGLDNRINAISPFLHTHRYDVIPTGIMDGVNDTFGIPGGETYVSGTLQVFLNGTKIMGNLVAELPGLATFRLLVFPEQLPNSAVNDTLEVNYILGP